jgi:hypothetical protein
MAAGAQQQQQQQQAGQQQPGGSAVPASPRSQQDPAQLAQLQSGWPPDHQQRVAAMRAVLLEHLQLSKLYDARVVLQALRSSALWHEQVGQLLWPAPARRAGGGRAPPWCCGLGGAPAARFR